MSKRLRDKKQELTQIIEDMQRWEESILDDHGRPMTPEQVNAELKDHRGIVSRIWWAAAEGKLTKEMAEYLLGESGAQSE